MTAYAGPIRLNTRDGLDNTVVRTNCSIAVGVATGGTGEISGGFTTNPRSTSDWANIQSVYQEYRVLGFEVKYTPYYPVPIAGGVLPSVGAMDVVHYSGAGSPASRDEVIQNATHKLWHSHRPLTMHYKARGFEELYWASTESDSDRGSIRWFIDGLSASSNYGVFTVTYLVELRGRQ